MTKKKSHRPRLVRERFTFEWHWMHGAATAATSISTNEYMFFNCSQDSLCSACEHFSEHCDSSCDSASYLCSHLPGSSYYPKATQSLRLMLKYCATYASVYWKNVGAPMPYDQVPEYGIR
ncbi:hypothetical protein JHK82_023638 [Glycine max]|nr:hypothetical protein JHK85_024196 [Glycine max]KAG5132450.1 hypothetical protein JHK82_023638 [Glycine max]